MDGFSKEPIRQKIQYLKHLQHEVRQWLLCSFFVLFEKQIKTVTALIALLRLKMISSGPFLPFVEICHISFLKLTNFSFGK